MTKKKTPNMAQDILDEVFKNAETRICISRAMLRTALVRADVGGYTTGSLEEAVNVLEYDTDKVYDILKVLSND